MTRPSERACCRRGGARQTEAKRSELHTLCTAWIEHQGVSGGWPLCACVQLGGTTRQYN